MMEINDTNLHSLSLDIVIQSIYFIKNDKFDITNEIIKNIIDNSKLISKCYITNVVEDTPLRTYLYN